MSDHLNIAERLFAAVAAGDGVPVEIPACLVATIRDGRITRLDEYLDSKHTKVLLAAASHEKHE